MSKGTDTRMLIVDTAVRMARYSGLGGLSIGSIAAAADMSKSGVWAHFKSKEALQLACMQENGDEFIGKVIRPALAAPRGIARMRSILELWMDWYSQPGGCLFLASTIEFDDLEGPLHDRMVSHQRDLLDCLAQITMTAVDEGEFATETDITQIAQEFFGILLGFNWTSRILKFPDSRERTRVAFERLVDSIRV